MMCLFKMFNALSGGQYRCGDLPAMSLQMPARTLYSPVPAGGFPTDTATSLAQTP